MAAFVKVITAFVYAAATFCCVCDAAAADPASAPVPLPSASPATSPAASAAPSASPSATPRPLGLHTVTDAALEYLDQATSGSGQTPPEAAGFIAGSPLAPNTPYDLFSSAPQTPGVAGIGQIFTTATYGFSRFDASLTGGLTQIDGSTTNAAYWGESLMPTVNPHVGSQAFPYAIVFPTHAGQDDATVTRASLLSGSLATADGNLRLKAGWFDLTQSDSFVFEQPQLTSINPQIGFAPAESLGNGPANLSDWTPYESALPLHGVDLVAKQGDGTLELSDAALPSLPGEGARQIMGSIVFDRGEGTRFSAQIEHVTTGGLLFETTIPSGSDPNYLASPEGTLPTSFLSRQRQTIAGLRGAFHVAPALSLDGIVEIGRAWYDASNAALPGTNLPGGFYHAGLIKTQGRVTASVDFFRMEPRYASIILPYGVPENQWSAAFAWPGQWLKSNYQLIDNNVLGINRQGYRFRYSVDKGPLEVHLEYTDLRQIAPETRVTAEQEGYVDGYYLPQFPGAATFGRQKRYGFWTAWHPSFGDLTLDIVDDTLYRPFDAGHPEDAVSYEVPQAVLTYSRTISSNVVASAGLGRYAMKGAFDEPLDFAQRTFLTGVEVKESPHTSLLVSYRRYAFGGLSTAPLANVSADYTGSLITVEQRLHL
jgi:hypothetical protein